MSRLELAKQGYKALAPLLGEHQDETVANRAESWLRDEVCPVVSELCQQPKFREATLWAVEHLSQNQTQPEWKLISKIDGYLVSLAIELLKAATEFKDVISSDDHKMLQFIAHRPWVELVSPLDFFHPKLNLNLRVTDPECWHHNRFRLRVYGDRLGDYVTLCMHGRIEHWQTILERIALRLTRALAPSKSDSPSYIMCKRIFDHRTRLLQEVKRLYEMCQDETERQWRDACMALVQIYVGYSIRPRLDWIPCGPGELETSGWSIRSVVRRPTSCKEVEMMPNGLTKTVREFTLSLCDPAVIRQVAAALETVSPLMQPLEESEDLITWARDEAMLVLVDGPIRRVFWEGEPVVVDWNKHDIPWDFLYVLACHPNAPVDKEQFRNPQRNPPKSRKGRLSGLLKDCKQLYLKIHSIRKIGYQLNLDRDEIIILEADGPEKLKIKR